MLIDPPEVVVHWAAAVGWSGRRAHGTHRALDSGNGAAARRMSYTSATSTSTAAWPPGSPAAAISHCAAQPRAPPVMPPASWARPPAAPPLASSAPRAGRASASRASARVPVAHRTWPTRWSLACQGCTLRPRRLASPRCRAGDPPEQHVHPHHSVHDVPFDTAVDVAVNVAANRLWTAPRRPRNRRFTLASIVTMLTRDGVRLRRTGHHSARLARTAQARSLRGRRRRSLRAAADVRCSP